MSTAVSTRHIPLSDLRDAARAIYAAAVRTPLVRVELDPGAPVRELYLKLEVLQPIGSFKIRGAYNVVRQLSPDELKDGVWTVSAGNAAQGVALAARKVGAPCSVMVMDTAPAAKVDAIRRLGASIVPATLRRVLEDRDRARVGSDERDTSSIRSTTIGSSPATAPSASRSWKICRTSTPSSRRSAAAACCRASPRPSSAIRPETRVFAAEPETAAPLAASLAAGRAVFFEGWTASFVDGAGGKSVLDSMWPLLRTLAGSLVVTLDDAARAMRLVAERAHVIAEGAAGCAVAAAASGRAGNGKVVAVVSGGNIDLKTFASLVAGAGARQG